jgi:putative cell wall-binding protein
MKRLITTLLLLLFIGSLSNYDVILVRSDLPPDWVIAQAYSQKSGIPIVTTTPNELLDEVKVQLKGYREAGYDRVLIIGGESAISLKVQREIEALGFVTNRISGADRHGTSARFAIELYPDSKECILVNGETYEGMLTALRIAGETGFPILFTRQNEVPMSVEDAMNTMRIERVVLVDKGISQEIKDYLSSQGYTVTTVGEGEDFKKKKLPKEVFSLLSGLVVGAFLVFALLRMKKGEKVSYEILTEDEQKVVDAIIENGGEIMQDQLPAKTGFSRPKVSRIVAVLCERKIVSKEPHGRTQRIRIEKEFEE